MPCGFIPRVAPDKKGNTAAIGLETLTTLNLAWLEKNKSTKAQDKKQNIGWSEALPAPCGREGNMAR